MIKPSHDYILAVQDSQDVKTKSGIYLQKETAPKPQTCTVVSVGKKVKEVKKGDKVIFKSYSITEVKLDGKPFILFKEEDALAIL